MKKRHLGTGAASLLIVLGCAGAAQAFSYGTLSVSYDGHTAGQGYGSFYGSGWNGAKLASTLRDTRTGDGQIYAEGNASGNNDYVKVQSSRRADGGSTFATMATKSTTAASGTAGWVGYAKVCLDRSWAKDPCSGQTKGVF
ncbi:hypothetical protein [Marmoricola sp. RAF53]|uniref:hypothetical protein n=1 Tax=Marmoricola sp. RAF53 TaxID=3233059 RepID=UPI003F9A5F85